MQSNKTKGYHRLKIVSESKYLIKLCYQVTKQFPSSELFGLTSQLRRASLSVLLNIVEGDRRKSNKDFYRFLNISDASLTELEACLEVAEELGFIDKQEYQLTEEQRQKTAYMLQALKKKVMVTLK